MGRLPEPEERIWQLFEPCLDDPAVEARIAELVAAGLNNDQVYANIAAPYRRQAWVDTYGQWPDRTHEDHVAFRAELHGIVAANKPMGIRQVFYQCEVRHMVTKTDTPGCDRVARHLTVLRKTGQLPYEWIHDLNRWTLKTQTFLNVEHALRHALNNYFKSLWTNEACLVRVFLEKDGLSDIVLEVTDEFDVPLLCCPRFQQPQFHSRYRDVDPQ